MQISFKFFFKSHLLTVLLVGACVYFCQLAFQEISLARQTNDLKEVRARVDYSGVSKRPGTKFHPTAWVVQVAYGYEVNDKLYKSQQIRRGKQIVYQTEESARSFIANYQERDIVQAHYNPANPKDSVLIAGSYVTAIFMLLGSLLGIFFGLSSLVAARHELASFSRQAISQKKEEFAELKVSNS